MPTQQHPRFPAYSPEAAAFAAGAAKAKSLCPGRPLAGAAHLPTASERQAFVDGWFSAR